MSRSTARYEPTVRDDEQELTEKLAELKVTYPEWGYKKMTRCLKNLGYNVNHKRVMRIWQRNGWQVPKKSSSTKKAPGATENACHVRCAEMGNQVWAVDFVSDTTLDGRKLRVLTVLDEYTREGLAIEVGRSMGAKQVREVLTALVKQRGAPQFVRSDNGSEFTAQLVQKALEGLGSESAFIAPGSPWQNGKNERFNGIVGQEVLNKELWGSVVEAQAVTKQWLVVYNTIRPHGSIGLMTPHQYALHAREQGLWFSNEANTG